MMNESLESLLALEKPARYFGGEIGAKPNEIKDSQGKMLRFALAFHDVYDIAHGYLGHKIIYEMFNQRPGFSAERVYAPWPDRESFLRKNNILLKSLENQRPLSEFDVVGFSLQYELGYTNILNMLELGGLPIRREQRTDQMPLVIAGGPGAYNPEPLADFFDIFFLGDAEAFLLEDFEIISQWKQNPKRKKEELYHLLAGRTGIYIPSLFKATYNSKGQILTPLKVGYEKIKRAVVTDLETASFPCQQITPFLKTVHDRVIVEIGRGCTQGCRFCQAGYIYRPVRERSVDKVFELVQKNLLASGQDEVSFLSLSAGDHSQIQQLVSGFMDTYAQEKIALSLPSLRVKSLKGELGNQIKRVRKTGFTLAPEAGTQRLRNVINKDLTEDDLMKAAELAFSLGWRTLKLYFMVGLPTEQEEDLEAIGILAKKIKNMTKGQLNLGIAHFTPKAHTPFQWHQRSSYEDIVARIDKVKKYAKLPGLTPKSNDPGASWVESILARGDRRMANVLEKVYRKGGRFEAWSDHFKLNLWLEALREEAIDEKHFLEAPDIDDILPWDHIDAGPSKAFLLRELEQAKMAARTFDCRWDKCHNCGACKNGVKNKLQDPNKIVSITPIEAVESQKATQLLIAFQKTGSMTLIGHLELMELFKRAFKRAGLILAQSQGFHPQPKLSLLTAIPLGIESYNEYARITVLNETNANQIIEKLNKQLPCGIKVDSANMILANQPKPLPKATIWRIITNENIVLEKQALYPEARVRHSNKTGRLKEYILSDFILDYQVENEHTLNLTIRHGLSGTPKPITAVAALWGLKDDNSWLSSLSKIKTILN